MTKTVKNMLDEAFEKVPMVEPDEAIKWIDDPDTIFVDVRDKESVINSGKIKGAIHAERGLLEFYADQEHDMGVDEISPEKSRDCIQEYMYRVRMRATGPIAEI